MNGVAAYGHWGRPVIVFPAERGDAGEFERRGMVAAIGDLLAAGRVKLYCVDSFDHETWSNRSVAIEERARRHQVYESWIVEQVVPFVRDDCGGIHEVIACEDTTGALEGTRRFAELLRAKGIRHEMDLWGEDIAHDWPSWRAQLAHHLPRFC